MQQQLTCNQVGALLAYYIENKLNKQLTTDIEYHLSICPACKKKFMQLKNIKDKISNSSQKKSEQEKTIKNTETNDKRYGDFKTNLSAYIDNELSSEENLRVKKFAISNPVARKDLEDIYNYKRLLHSSFTKTKNETKEDFTKNTLNQIYAMNNTNKFDKFYLLMILFIIIMATALLGVAHFFPF